MILGISGSGRNNGETAKMVKTILENSGEVYDYISLASKRVDGCMGCLKCAVGDGECRLKDDFPEILEKMKAADVVVLGFPNYGSTVNAKTHALLERLYSTRHGVYHLGGKYFVPVTPSGADSDGMHLVIKNLLNNKGVILGKVEGGNGAAPCFDCGFGHECYAGHAIPKGGGVMSKEEVESIRPFGLGCDPTVKNLCIAAGQKIAKAVQGLK